jgi:hypothetical protein
VCTRRHQNRSPFPESEAGGRVKIDLPRFFDHVPPESIVLVKGAKCAIFPKTPCRRGLHPKLNAQKYSKFFVVFRAEIIALEAAGDGDEIVWTRFGENRLRRDMIIGGRWLQSA